jgi:hypothetical protein
VEVLVPAQFAEAVLRYLAPIYRGRGNIELGVAYVRVNRLQDAKQQFERIPARDPGAEDARSDRWEAACCPRSPRSSSVRLRSLAGRLTCHTSPDDALLDDFVPRLARRQGIV